MLAAHILLQNPKMKFTNLMEVKYFILVLTQDGNFRAGELFPQQSTGIVTISAEYRFRRFIRTSPRWCKTWWSGAVIREFSRIQTFFEDPNNVIPHKELLQHSIQ